MFADCDDYLLQGVPYMKQGFAYAGDAACALRAMNLSGQIGAPCCCRTLLLDDGVAIRLNAAANANAAGEVASTRGTVQQHVASAAS